MKPHIRKLPSGDWCCGIFLNPTKNRVMSGAFGDDPEMAYARWMLDARLRNAMMAHRDKFEKLNQAIGLL